jgi:predicted kinase
MAIRTPFSRAAAIVLAAQRGIVAEGPGGVAVGIVAARRGGEADADALAAEIGGEPHDASRCHAEKAKPFDAELVHPRALSLPAISR